MEVKVKLQEVIVKDKKTGEEFTVLTARTAEEIAGYLEESEKDEMECKLEEVVDKAHEEHRLHTD